MLGSRVVGAILKSLKDRRQVWFTDEGVIIVKLPRLYSRLKVVDLGRVVSPERVEKIYDFVSSCLDEIDKRKEAEFASSEIASIEMAEPKTPVFGRNKPGILRFRLKDGRVYEVHIEETCKGGCFRELLGLVEQLYPGKVGVFKQ